MSTKPQVAQLRVMELLLESGSPVFLWGEPGIGKTAGVQRWAESRGYKLKTLIGSILDPTDLSGIPTLTANGRTRFAPPEWLLQIVDEAATARWVVFLDELNCSAPSVMAAMLRLVNEKAVHEHILPPQTLFLAAGNDPNQVEIANDLPASMASRFAHLEWIPYAGRDKLLAQAEGWPVPAPLELDAEKVASRTSYWRAVAAEFQTKRPDTTFDFKYNDGNLASSGQAYPTGRTWSMAENALGMVDALPDGEELRLDVVAALISKSVAGELLTFERDLDLPDPEEWLADPSQATPLEREDQTVAAMNAITHAILRNNTPKRWLAGWRIAIAIAKQNKQTLVIPMVVMLSNPEHYPANAETILTDEVAEGILEHFSDLEDAQMDFHSEHEAAKKELNPA